MSDWSFPTVGGGDVEIPEIELDDESLYATITTEEDHDKLLRYLMSRLHSDQTNRQSRMQRFARIDKTVSTWQKLDEADSVRMQRNEATGKGIAVNMNLPLITTHLEDMVSFYAGIYSPASGSFYQIPEVGLEAAGKELVTKLNGDAETTRYYTNLIRALRALLKYNMGGLHLEFGDEDLLDLEPNDKALNHGQYLDLYNTLWDPLISDPSLVRKEAEWAAVVHIRSRMWLVKRERSGYIVGAHDVIEAQTNGRQATYYRNPPAQAGVTSGDAQTGPGDSDGVDWGGYGQALAGEDGPSITGHEVVTMYCWLNPGQFGLGGQEHTNAAKKTANYVLWKFLIVDGKRIVHAKPVEENPDLALPIEIPIYMGQQLLDDMGLEQRSTAELMAPFQNYTSFLLNGDVNAIRSAVFGTRVYDPSAIDMSKVPEGTVVADIATKAPGRDVNTILKQINGQVDTGMVQKMGQVMSMMKEFFPAQALPSQIAGIDRAVTNQVSAVMQGISRRLHTTVNTLDNDLFGPFAHACYRNLSRVKHKSTQGLEDDVARRILSSGLAQLQRESIESAVRQMLFALIQNPEAAGQIDVMALFQYWGSLLNSNLTVSSFIKKAPPQAAPPPQAQNGAAPTTPVQSPAS